MTAPANAPQGAASVVLARNPNDPEIFWVRRGPHVSYLGGFHSFPGGRVDAADAHLEGALSTDEPRGFRVAALRELFEEVGVIACANGLPANAEALAAGRKRLLNAEVTFEALLREWSVTLHAEEMPSLGHWITPAFAPRRFDAYFFLTWLPEGQRAEIWPGELESGEWIRPRDALAAWKSKRILMAPPTVHTLRALAQADPDGWTQAALATQEARGGEVLRIEMRPGIQLVPLRSLTIPPATHTNTYIVGNGSELVVVDPGSDDVEECARLEAQLQPRLRAGAHIQGIILTHHHIDHVAGAHWLKQLTGAPIWAHDRTAAALGTGLGIDRIIADGEQILLKGSDVPRLRVLHTPGHTAGHVALFDEVYGSLLTGDLVVGYGTVIIDPPDGDMLDYMTSLRTIRALDIAALFPGHGPVLGNPEQVLEFYIRHRGEREAKVIAAMEAGARLPADIVRLAYADVPEKQWPYAERSLLAILLKLEKENRCQETGGAWRLRN